MTAQCGWQLRASHGNYTVDCLGPSAPRTTLKLGCGFWLVQMRTGPGELARRTPAECQPHAGPWEQRHIRP